MKIRYTFGVTADCKFEVPGVTKMMEEMTGQGIFMVGDKLELGDFHATVDEPMTLDQIEKIMTIAEEVYESEECFSNVFVSYLGKEEVEDV
jgi:hypothetical protein